MLLATLVQYSADKDVPLHLKQQQLMMMMMQTVQAVSPTCLRGWW
jgi:hypothetical protein